ncbi:TPA: hypothetical protein L3677_005848 [Pseudomonas aeruginosa]|nr:hypothetical protein [Pseudomonas aeruginosa]
MYTDPFLKRKRLVVLSLMTFVSLCLWGLYGRALGFDYVWDDSLLFLDKTDLLNLPLSWKLLAEPVLPGTSYLRPLVFLTFYVEFHAFGQSALVSHAVNLIIFNFNAILVFWVCRRIAFLLERSLPELLGFLAAMLYVIHPALVESSVWVSGRFDLMVTTFLLLGVGIFLAEIKSGLFRVLLLSACMMAALLSKELGVVFPALILCVWMALNCSAEPIGRGLFFAACSKNFTVLFGLVLTVLFYFVVREFSAGGFYHSPLTTEYAKDAILYQRLPLEALKFYLLQSFLPFYSISPLHPVSEYQEGGVLLSALGQLCTLLLLLGVGYMAAYRRSVAAWLAIAYLVCLLPVVHIIPMTIGGNLGHERFLTAPLAFLAMSVVLVRYDLFFSCLRLARPAYLRVLTFATFVWLVAAGFTVNGILPMWSSEVSLWTWAYKDHPDFQYARYNYLYGASRFYRYDLVDKEVERLQRERGGLEVSEQLLYANRLIRTGDAEGMKYLEGVIYAFPKFHEEKDGRSAMKNFTLLTSMQMGGAYADYANALMIFKGDAEKALKYSVIAEWYLGKGELIPLMYQRSAIFYALGEYSRAERIYNEQERYRYYMKSGMRYNFSSLLKGFCKASSYKKESCGEMIRRGIILNGGV